MSEADCRNLIERLERVAKGGGYTAVQMASTWTGNIRWARNQIVNGGDVSNNKIVVTRNLEGGSGYVVLNDTTDAALMTAARQAERLAQLQPARFGSDLIARRPMESYETPQLFDEATYQLTAERRASAAITLAQTAAASGMLSAGYIGVLARSLAVLDTKGRVLYFPYTQAQYSVTVRDPQGTSSGWAGVDWDAWQKIDAAQLTATALQKCLQSKNPVRIEPGRYTTVLESQAVSDFIGCLFVPPPLGNAMEFSANAHRTSYGAGPFNKTLQVPGYTRLGEKIVDERITIQANPHDPKLGFPPFSLNSRNIVNHFLVPVYHPVTWIDHGVLTHLAYDYVEAIGQWGQDHGLPNSGAFHMSGGDTSVDEMIATTKRGILVTRFDQILMLDWTSQLYRGYTRDGLWLIENGKISKAIKNFVFTESILFALNNIDQLGVPQRVFHPDIVDPFFVPQPRVVPPLKIRDFSFTALTDAV
jgi:predicted Zn-dependent protease